MLPEIRASAAASSPASLRAVRNLFLLPFNKPWNRLSPGSRALGYKTLG